MHFVGFHFFITGSDKHETIFCFFICYSLFLFTPYYLPYFYLPFSCHTVLFFFLSLFPLFRGSHRVVDRNYNFTCYPIFASEKLSAFQRTVMPTSSGSISPRRKILKIESAHSSETPITCLSSRTTCIHLALVSYLRFCYL